MKEFKVSSVGVTEFIVVVEKQYSPGKVLAPIEDEEMAPEGWDHPVSCTR